METLFRFVLKRPAIAQSEDAPSIRLAQESQFQAALGQAQQTPKPRDALKTVALQFITTSAFVGDPESLAIYGQLKKLGVELTALEKKKDVTNAEVSQVIENAFVAHPADLVKKKTLDVPLTSLRDSLIAIKLIPEEHRRPIEDLTNQLRDLEMILKVADDANFPGDGPTLRRYRRRSVMLPTEADLRSSLATIERQKELEKQRKEAEEKKRKEAEAKLDIYNRLKTAVKELTSLSGAHLYSTPQEADAGFLVPAAFRPIEATMQEMTQRKQLSQLQLLRMQVALGKGESSEEREQVAADTKENNLSDASLASQARAFIAGKGPFKPLKFEDVAFRLKPTAERSLSASTIEILKERGLSISEQALDQIIEILREEITSLSKELDSLLGRPVKRTFKRMGNTMVMIKTPMPSVWNNIVIGADFTGSYLTLWDSRVPHSHGSVESVGPADLLVVKQQLVRYEGADVAHIENILKGEKKEREHTRRRETEELLFTETEITTSEERELESTNRFEMSRETSETIKEDASLKAGLSVSGKYGPTVEFSASAEGSFSRSKEEATKTAAKFSQDVTQRSATKVTERVLERSSLRVTNEVIEKNGHVLDNVGGSGHISGVYQWVNKVYLAQMYNYGIRTMYDFMVPEPGAFLIEALQSAHANAIEIEKPVPFTLRPDQITESNYHTWVLQYGATDVQPPPEMYQTKSLDFKAGGGDSRTDYNHSGQIQVEDGYKAIHGTVGIAGNIWEGNAGIDVVLGNRTHRFSGGLGSAAWSTSLTGETDSIPFALNTWRYSDIAVAVEVKCQRTDRAMMKWRLDTHAKLTNAYKARLSEYEEKLASLEMQAGVAIQGKNPALNLELMNDELKKNCISILTEQHFDLFAAIGTGTNGLPQIDLDENEAEGPYVRFFEQAFEWEHMTWVTYPYFWGRKSQWDERIAYEDSDPLFNQFLKAGYCRVSIPARPGFEGAIDHFMTYGEIWNGGPLPAISNPLYLPIADEIAERLDRPGDEFPEGDPWLVRIPTTLVHLRADDKLPEWEQDS
jgi:hypothetical protein